MLSTLPVALIVQAQQSGVAPAVRPPPLKENVATRDNVITRSGSCLGRRFSVTVKQVGFGGVLDTLEFGRRSATERQLRDLSISMVNAGKPIIIVASCTSSNLNVGIGFQSEDAVEGGSALKYIKVRI